MPKPKFWLFKTEPKTYSIDSFARDKTTLWDGVRNYQARNFMMKEMNPGDRALIYHSNAKPPGVVGLAVVSKEAAPDPTQWDKNSAYFDKKSTRDKPRWFCVELRFVAKFPRLISLEDIKKQKVLKKMTLVQPGSRLSIQPVRTFEYERIIDLSQKPEPSGCHSREHK